MWTNRLSVTKTWIGASSLTGRDSGMLNVLALLSAYLGRSLLEAPAPETIMQIAAGNQAVDGLSAKCLTVDRPA